MTWLPGIVVLVAGLLAGLIVARRLRSGQAETTETDLELRAADLEERRDDLYRRLREIDEGLAPETDREALEGNAARTLQELDQLKGKLARKRPRPASEPSEAPEALRPATPARPTRVFFTGFAYGAGLLLLIGGLIYWAVRDAQPRPDENAPMASPTPGPGAQPPHPGLDDLPPAVAERIASITRHLESDPEDLGARKELGYTYLGASRFVEAFRSGEEILTRQPEDPDGLYLQGVVRLTMGQVELAEQLLDRALTSQPAHADSLTAAGIIRLRQGDYEQAVALWRRGLATLGGSHPMIERMIALAEERRSPQEILGFGGPQQTETPAAPEPRSAAVTPSPDVLTISIELAPGATAPPGSTLFVSFRGESEGPPAAVKRIDRPTFPLTLTLGQQDSMLGRPLPGSGTLSARLDQDGSASTRDPGDLSDSVEASLGQAMRLRLIAGG